MINVINEGNSYDWLTTDTNKELYIYKYINDYIDDILHVSINIQDNDSEYKIPNSSIFSVIRTIIENGKYYSETNENKDTINSYDKSFISSVCKYKHKIYLFGDFKKSVFIIKVTVISDSIPNSEFISLYNNEDEILMSILDEEGELN